MLGSLPVISEAALLMAPQILAALIISALVGIAARTGVRSASRGQDDLSPAWSSLPAFLGGLSVFAFGPHASLSPGAGAAGFPAVLLLPKLLDVAIGSVLLALAAADRQTAWAPDSLLYPLAALVGARFGIDPGLPSWTPFGGSFSWLIWSGMGVAIVLAVQAAWSLSGALTARIPPPPDLAAFLLGPALLGPGPAYAVAMIAISLLLLLVRLRPDVSRAFQAPSVVEAASEDLGYGVEDGPAVPLLAVMLPVYLLTFLWIGPSSV